jgi:hypothetical protein
MSSRLRHRAAGAPLRLLAVATFGAVAATAWASAPAPVDTVSVEAQPASPRELPDVTATTPAPPTTEAPPAAFELPATEVPATAPPATEPPTTRPPAPTTTTPATTTTLPACSWSVPGCVSGWAVRTSKCLEAPPASPADYQRVFDDRRVWAGGDVAKSVTLPDGRVLWLFGDTFTRLSSTGAMAGPMLRNSLVVQKDRCFSFVHGGTVSMPTTPLPASKPNSWFWPASATVDAPGNAVHIVGRRVVEDRAESFGWRITGTDVVTLLASDLGFVSVAPAPVPQNGKVIWSGSALTTGGHTYIYAFADNHQIVARTTPATLASVPWEYWTGTGWHPDLTQARPPEIEKGPVATFTIVPHNGGFLAAAKQAEMDSRDVSTWWSTSPTGPWTHRGPAASTAGEGTPYITYAGQVVRLPGAGLVTVWSQNRRNRVGDFDYRNYGPRFAPPLARAIP